MRDLIAFVLGDSITDTYQEVRVRRIAPDAPAPVWESVGDVVTIPGGALNVARQFQYLAEVTYFAGFGAERFSDQASSRLRLLSRYGISPEKLRYHSNGHVLARFDRGPSITNGHTRERHSTNALVAVARKLEELNVSGGVCGDGKRTVGVLSDYRLGFWDSNISGEAVRLFRKHGIPFVVDSKPGGINLDTIGGAACLKLNEGEAAELSGRKDEDAALCGMNLSERYGVPVVVTRGKHSPVLCERSFCKPCGSEITSDRPLWASGAGDCFTAYLAAGIASAGRVNSEACHFAHAAGSVYVTKQYNSPVHPREVAEEFRRTGCKLYQSGSELRERIAALPEGTKIGYTNGVFDLLHAGHVSSLEFARSLCDFLVVFLNTDEAAERAKGRRPYITTAARASMLAALSCVDAVISFDEAEPTSAFAAVGRCDVLVKGAEYAGSDVKGSGFAESVVFAPEAVKLHTSDIARKIRES